MPAPKMRVAWETIGRVTLINDAYNANPGSTRAAIELLKGIGSGPAAGDRPRHDAGARCGVRQVSRRHQPARADSGADIVAGIGDFAASLRRVDAETTRVVTAASVGRSVAAACAATRSRDAVILLKASRGVQLERLVPHLTTWATA